MTRRSNESAFRHPDTVAPIRSMIESEAAVHPPTFRVCKGGIIRCRRAWCVQPGFRCCGVPAAGPQSAGAGDAAQPALMPANATSAARRAILREICPATLRARAWPTDGNCRRPPVHGHSLARAKPSLPASDGCRGKINRVRCQSPIGFGPVSSERAIMEVRMRRRYSLTSSGRLRAVPAASTSIMAMNTSREAEGL